MKQPQPILSAGNLLEKSFCLHGCREIDRTLPISAAPSGIRSMLLLFWPIALLAVARGHWTSLVLFYPNLVLKRILHLYLAVFLPVLQVLAKQKGGTGRLCRRENQRIPEGDSEATLDFRCS